jgi:type III pantothenate kinase
MNLLIDVGNTRLKWATLQDGALIKGRTLVNRFITLHELIETWKNLKPPERLAIACVSANSLLEMVMAAANELWQSVDIVTVKSEYQAFGVYNAYQHPEKLGVDRWLGLVAVRNHYPLPACVVDCGTAITLDLIDLGGKHQGGMICPGLMLMKKSLAEGTASLQFHEKAYDIGPANFTEAAIYNGTLAAAVGLIEHVVKNQSKTLHLILTGGDAEIIAAQLEIKFIIDTDLVLRGLALILENQ